MKKILLILGIFSLVLISGCVSDTEFQDVANSLYSCSNTLKEEQKDLVICNNIIDEMHKEKEECKEIEEPYFKECPYDCGEYRECKEIIGPEGNIRNWQCVTIPF